MHVAAAKPFKHDIHVAVAIPVMTFVCSALLCCAVLCCAVLCCAVLCCAVLCCATQIKVSSSDMHTAILASRWQVQIMPTGQAMHSQS